MPISKIELKKVSRNFRAVASRFLKTDASDGILNLRKFLNFIHSEPLISGFIEKKNHFTFDIDSQVKAIQNSYDEYPIPEDVDEEISYVYQFLVYVAENYVEYRHPISYGYGGTKFQDQVDDFNKRVVLPFINYIETFLDELLLDVEGESKSTGITIHADSSQVNISNDRSSLTATQTVTKVENDVDAMFRILSEQIRKAEIPSFEKEEALEVLDLAKCEVTSEAPKKSILRMAVQKLKELTSIGVAGIALNKTVQDVIAVISGYLK